MSSVALDAVSVRCALHAVLCCFFVFFFFFNDTATTEIYTLSLHDALPISDRRVSRPLRNSCRYSSPEWAAGSSPAFSRSEEHTSELQSHSDLVCRLLLEKKKNRSRVFSYAPPLPITQRTRCLTDTHNLTTH